MRAYQRPNPCLTQCCVGSMCPRNASPPRASMASACAATRGSVGTLKRQSCEDERAQRIAPRPHPPRNWTCLTTRRARRPGSDAAACHVRLSPCTRAASGYSRRSRAAPRGRSHVAVTRKQPKCRHRPLQPHQRRSARRARMPLLSTFRRWAIVGMASSAWSS